MPVDTGRQRLYKPQQVWLRGHVWPELHLQLVATFYLSLIMKLKGPAHKTWSKINSVLKRVNVSLCETFHCCHAQFGFFVIFSDCPSFLHCVYIFCCLHLGKQQTCRCHLWSISTTFHRTSHEYVTKKWSWNVDISDLQVGKCQFKWHNAKAKIWI